MRKYGIIGVPLGHSWSGEYFGEKFREEGIDAEYRLYECNSQADLKPTLSRLDGCNITIPYKEAVIPLLEEIDPVAREIGAVNVVKKVHNAQCTMHNEFRGYNTDWIGFTQSLKPLLNENVNANANRALIFGTGGVAKAVAYGLMRLGISYNFVSRNAQCTMHNAQCRMHNAQCTMHNAQCLNYETLTKEIIEEHKILINCTPLGMWPNVEDCVPIPYEGIGAAHILFDCVYNPEETEFLRRGRERGARTKNGLEMLHIQADEAYKIWEK